MLVNNATVMSRIFRFSITLLGALTLFACSRNDDTEGEVPTPVGTMTFEIGGADRTSTQFVASALFGDVNGNLNSLGLTAGFADLSGNFWTLTMIITEQQPIPEEAGLTWNEMDLNTGTSFSAAYQENFDPEQEIFNGVYADGEPFSVTITAIDPINRLISGEFSLVMKPETEDSTYEITRGIFNRIPYAVN